MPASVRLKGGAILTATRTTGPAELTIGVRRPLPSPDASTISYLPVDHLVVLNLRLTSVLLGLLTMRNPSPALATDLLPAAAGEEVRPRLLD
eukprot:COSAG04_NODE_3762_length_2553_cov_1.007746_5_plen_92_part_00